MKFFSLLKENVTLAPGEKIIPAKEFSSLKKAATILKIAQTEAIEYRKKTAKNCEIIKEHAYQGGFEHGLQKLNEKILLLDQEIKKFEDEMQKKILPIALKAAKKILGEELKLHPDRIVDIVIQAIKPVTKHFTIKIYVNKSDLPVLEKGQKKIKNILEQVKAFSLQARDDIEPGGCIIETEAGIINAQLENQWRALEIAFDKFLKK